MQAIIILKKKNSKDAGVIMSGDLLFNEYNKVIITFSKMMVGRILQTFRMRKAKSVIKFFKIIILVLS